MSLCYDYTRPQPSRWDRVCGNRRPVESSTASDETDSRSYHNRNRGRRSDQQVRDTLTHSGERHGGRGAALGDFLSSLKSKMKSRVPSPAVLAHDHQDGEIHTISEYNRVGH